MPHRKIDRMRILALFMIFLGILYFYGNILAPRLIPRIFRVGIIRKPITVLVLGTDLTFDAKTGEPIAGSDGRTDSILLLHVDPARYKIHLLSIPRDSFISIPEHGMNKINAANVFGGTELIRSTVENLTGKKIDYYIKIDPFAITKIVDLLGGVKLYVEKDMYYVDRAQNLNINLKQGWQKLSGKEAQDYMRFRHDTFGDIGRIERQQKLLQAIFFSFARPANLLKAPVVIESAAKHIQTDLPLSKMIRLANLARMLSPRDILTFTASGESGTSDFAGSIWLINRGELEHILRNYF
jgi:LCP family protein required for cell wall assembly